MPTQTKRSARNGAGAASTTPAPAAEAPTPATIPTAAGAISQDLPISQIGPSPLNPRKAFAEGPLADLADSIREHGLLEPIVIRRSLAGPLPYEIVAGERRWRAAQLTGLERIPCRVLPALSDVDHLKLALVENLQRQDLDPIEEAQGYRQLAEIAGMRQAAIAAAVNRAQPTIANRLRLLDLPSDVQELLRAGQLTAAHGVALAKWKAFPKLVSAIAASAVEESLTSKEIERGLPNPWKLRESGLIAALTAYEAKFDTAVCRDCPFSARHDGYCLKPDHFRELQREAQVQRQRVADGLRERATEAGTSAIELDKLRHNDYASLAYGTRPSGCSNACPCFREALDRDDSIVPVCIDPGRFRKLGQADEKTQRAARREAHRAALAQVVAQMDALDQPDARSLAVLAALAIDRINSPSLVKAAAERVAPGEIAIEQQQNRIDWLTPERLDQLAALAPDRLVRFAVEAIVRQQLHDLYESSYTWASSGRLARWYLGPFPGDATEPAQTAAPPPAEPDDDRLAERTMALQRGIAPDGDGDDYPAESDHPCTVCGGVIVLRSPEQDRRLAQAVAAGRPDLVVCESCHGEPVEDPEPVPDRDYPYESDLTCERCGQPVTISSAEEDRQLARAVEQGTALEILCDGCAELPVPVCRVCGCTDEAGCAGGCEWVEDDLCSACVREEAAP